MNKESSTAEDKWDELAKEADMLALAVATGVLNGPQEVDRPHLLDNRRRQIAARRRRWRMDQNRRSAKAFQEIADRKPVQPAKIDTGLSDEELRAHANQLWQQGWSVAEIQARLGIAPRSDAA